MLSGFTGYLQAVYQDADDPMGRRFYFEAKKETITENKPFTLTVSRSGASKGEYNGADNFASTTFQGEVQPPTLFTLSPVKNPEALEQDLPGMLHRGSLKLREDKPNYDERETTMNLKQRRNEIKDEHVPVEYKAYSALTDPDAPKEVRSIYHYFTLLYLVAAGYDILACDSIDAGDPQYAEVFGMTWLALDFMAISKRAPNPDRSLLHEVGHCVDLDHWDVDPDSDSNIMRSIGPRGGPYAPEAMDVSEVYPSGNSQAKRYKEGLDRWKD